MEFSDFAAGGIYSYHWTLNDEIKLDQKEDSCSTQGEFKIADIRGWKPLRVWA
jgi:hypothetical protein